MSEVNKVSEVATELVSLISTLPYVNDNVLHLYSEKAFKDALTNKMIKPPCIGLIYGGMAGSGPKGKMGASIWQIALIGTDSCSIGNKEALDLSLELLWRARNLLTGGRSTTTNHEWEFINEGPGEVGGPGGESYPGYLQQWSVRTPIT